MQGGKKSRINFYKTKITDGELELLDDKNFQGFEWVKVEDLNAPKEEDKPKKKIYYSKNKSDEVEEVRIPKLRVTIKNTIIDDQMNIHKTFVSLFLLKSVMGRSDVNINFISNAKFNLPTHVEKDADYVQYYCTELDEYFVVKEGDLPPIASEDAFDIYTTRIDTVFGMSYVALAPEHPLVKKITTKDRESEVTKYVKASSQKTELQRLEQDKEKTGVFTGAYAINPFTNTKVPIWVADYVLMDYGTGAVMAVPAHDERDWEFAKKYDLPIIQSVAPYFTGAGEDGPKEDKETEYRHNMHILLKHHKKNEYLMMDRGKYGRKSMIIGGWEAGETIEEAAIREIQEETGYQNIKFIEKVDVEVHANFFAPHKDENRYAYDHLVICELKDDKKEKIDEEELAKHTPAWVKTDNISDFINIENEKYLWNLYHKGHHAHPDKGVVINSDSFSNMSSDEAIKEMQHWLETRKVGEAQTNYRIQNWVFSRQRYWGEPFPFIHHPDGHIISMDPKDLPLELPEVTHYEPTGTEEGPLAAIDNWINVTLPDGTMAKRESNTMPGWA